MAMFPTHIKCSTLAGIGGGIAAHFAYGVPLTTSAVGAGLCCVGGILPDIDSGPGIPLREITTFLASVVPTMLITRLLSYNFTQESLILTGGIIYVAIRFGLSHFLREYTVHRGMFHSFPSMAIFGELTYLLFYGESMFVRLFMVGAVCLGFFIHLLLDEIYSVEWDGRPHVKKSFGSAMKFVGNGWWPNFACYAKLAVLTFLVMNDPSVIHQFYTGQGQEVAKNLGQAVKEQFDSAMAQTRSMTSGHAAPMAIIPASPTSGPWQGTTIPPNSSTVQPPALAWPAAPAAMSDQPLIAPQPAVTPATAGGPVPAANRPSSPAPSRQTSGTRFWQ